MGTPIRVILFATHPNSSNGYSKVAYELAKRISSSSDIELIYYGFQNFHKNPLHETERTLPSNVVIYDAYKNEAEPKQQGFGFSEVTEFVTKNEPDVCIIYNDMVVVSTILDGLNAVKEKGKNFKTIVYLDQVYLCQRKEHVQRLNKDADMVICFSEFWKDCIIGQGLVKKTRVLEHGFNPSQHYPIPKALSRIYFNLGQDDFIILNANRNQPRKRLDIMMMSFAMFISRHIDEPIKLLIATAHQGAWHLLELYERELKQYGISLEEGMKHIVLVDRPQALTDEDINILYNTADVGINCAMGEGWGLCNFESAAIGIPQIVPDIGGFKDFFDKDSALLVQPKVKLYTDMTIDGCPGVAEICDYVDFADAMETYYADQELRKAHATNARSKIIKKYNWDDLSTKLVEYIKESVDWKPQHPPLTTMTLEEIKEAFGSDISCGEDVPHKQLKASKSMKKNKKNKKMKIKRKVIHTNNDSENDVKKMKISYDADEETSDNGHTEDASTLSDGANMPEKTGGSQGEYLAQSPPKAVPKSAASIDVAAMSADELLLLREQLEKALKVKG